MEMPAESSGREGDRWKGFGWNGEREKRRQEECEPEAGRPHPAVSVVVVNFNGGDLLTGAVAAALSSDVPVEVLVVDNASRDSSVTRLRGTYGDHPRVRVFENEKNIGFARATNLALTHARGRFLLLLNPDCIVEPDTLSRLLALLEQRPDVGMAGCLIRNADGSEQAGCRRAVPTPWRSLVRVFHLDRLFPQHPRFRNFVLSKEPLPDEPVYVEAISGALMLVRREALEQVGPLDEGYFLHCEDLDWCFRFRAAGWKILFVPDVEVVHYGGVCGADRPIFVHWHKHRGMIRFYRKFFRHQYPLPLMVLVTVAVWGRFAVLATRDLVKRGTHAVRMGRVGRTALPVAHVSAGKDRRRSGSNRDYGGPERRAVPGDSANRSEAA